MSKAVVLRLSVLLSACAHFIGTLSSVRAEEVHYANIGWWTVAYRPFDNLNGCNAESRFTDQTLVEFALLESQSEKGWALFLSNPQWDAWVKKGAEHRLIISADGKIWRGSFKVADDKKTLFIGGASIDFMNSLADAHSLMIFDSNQRPLTSSPLSMKDSADAIKAVVNCVREHPLSSQRAPEPAADTAVSGTGFFVASNVLLTNNHVVKDCQNTIKVRYPDKEPYTATISGQDPSNDLALLHTEMPSHSIASFHLQPRLGEGVAAYGFPYAGVLSSSGNFTLGNVTSLSGMGDDTRFLQISAPIQPGNSGGPLVDMSGSVVGVVVSQLNALAVMQVANSVPQNVNFAIQVPMVINFLSVKGVTPKLDTSQNGTHTLSTADVADITKQFTVQIFCETGSSPSPQKPVVANRSGDVEQQATNFVVSLQAKWSRPNAEALAGLDALYDDEVMYFGKRQTKPEVIKEVSAFATKFPERQYKPRLPMDVSCNERFCTVRGTLDFRSVNLAERKVSKGAATFEYQLVVAGSSFIISLEGGEVLKREVSPLSSASPQSTDEHSASLLHKAIGRWAVADAANCSVPSKSFSLTMDGQTIVWRNGEGEIDIEAVVFSGEDQFVTTTVKSLHASSTRDIAPGTNWVYSRDRPGRLQVQPSGRNSFLLTRCQ
jgi:S1-C subfamily serine protease